MTIRPAQLRDASAIAEIQMRGWQSAYAHFLDPAHLEGMTIESGTARWRSILTGDSPATTIVREHDGAVVGFAGHGPSRRPGAPDAEGELWAIYVDDRVQGQGHGAALVAACVDALRAAGYARAVLFVFALNANGRGFYEHHGWVHEGEHESRWGTELRYGRDLT